MSLLAFFTYVLKAYGAPQSTQPVTHRLQQVFWKNPHAAHNGALSAHVRHACQSLHSDAPHAAQFIALSEQADAQRYRQPVSTLAQVVQLYDQGPFKKSKHPPHETFV